MSRIKILLTLLRLNKLSKFSKVAKQHTYLTIGTVVALTTLVSSAVYAATSNNKPTVEAHKTTQTQVGDTPRHTSSKQSTVTADAEHTQPNQAAESKPANTPTAKPGAPASTQAVAQPSQRRLKVSPSTITVKAGGTANVTVSTEDGKAVTMPMFSGSTPSLFTNFAAAPFKQSWTGNIMSMTTSPPGTYNVELRGQLDRNTWYHGPITVIITPTPYATVSVSQIGYDVAEDVMLFSVKLTRLYGYDKPIQYIFGYTLENNVECYSEAVDGDTYIMGCTPNSPARPGSGTIRVNVSTPDNSFGGNSGFSLPPR